jgi:predicted RNase H-like nuclease (RuvC/YqgF family)
MDNGTRDAIPAMGDRILDRMDFHFELQQKQFLELRERVDTLTERVDALTQRVAGLEHEVAQLRDYVTREISEIRFELRVLRARSEQSEELRREIVELGMRVDRLERRQQRPGAPTRASLEVVRIVATGAIDPALPSC